MSDTNMITDWDSYALSFSSVMPFQMIRLNREVASHMHGDVVDFGCGGGKIIPYLLRHSEVTSYTGVDASAQMISNAQWIADRYTDGKVTLINGRIEDTKSSRWDSALSINSYYTWDDPQRVLRRIHACLPANTRFVLATINSDINMPALLEEAQMELVAHPHWPAFRDHNLQISDNTVGSLVDMDTLVRQLQNCGFRIEEATRHLYNGGLNLVVCTRG